MGYRDFLAAAFLIAKKDLMIEFRRPYEILSILAFAVSALFITGLAMRGGGAVTPRIVAAVIWIIIFFSTILTFTTSFTREADQCTLGGLKTLPCPYTAILAGKIMFGSALIFLVICVIVPCSVFFFHLDLGGRFPLLLLVCLLGAAGCSFAGSFVSGLVMFSEGKTLLLSLLLIPVCIPVLLLSVMTTGKIIGAAGLSDILPELRLLLAFILLLSAVMTVTFPYVLED